MRKVAREKVREEREEERDNIRVAQVARIETLQDHLNEIHETRMEAGSF